MTFTLPEELRRLCRSNQSLCYDLLFDESAGTLKDVAAQPRHLGAGFLGVLHSWTRQLSYHPHVHYIVPGGGLRADHRKWRKCRHTRAGEPYLLPVQVLSARFRNRFSTALKERAPELHARVPASVWRRDWVVHSQAAGTGREVTGYLARYVFRTALSNKRILSDQEGRVAFSYVESTAQAKRKPFKRSPEAHSGTADGVRPQSATGQGKVCTLDAMTFLARVLQHVLPPGLHKVRYFGWLHPRAQRRRLIVQTLLAVALVLSRREEPASEIAFHLLCPHCHRPALRIIARLRRSRPP